MDNKQLNILFLCSWYPNPDDISNGIFIKRHAEALAIQHKVTVLFAKSVKCVLEKEYTETVNGNLREVCVFYPKKRSKIPFFSSFKKLNQYKKIYQGLIDDYLSMNQPDIIHLNVIFPACIPALNALKKCPSAKLFITEHWSGYYQEDGNYKGIYLKSLSKKAVHKANAIFVISDKLKDAMLRHGLSGTYELTNNVVDTNVFKPTNNFRLENPVLRILHVSSLVDREKNISGIIEVAKRLKKIGFNFQIYFIGRNDNEIIEYKNLVHQSHLHTHISFLGYKSPAEISEYMNQADVFLLMSHFEGMPVVLLEAMACGLPVITTDVGQVRKIIRPGMGTVLNANSIEECVEKLSKFKNEKFSEKQVMHHYIESNFGMKAVSDSITNLYYK